MAGNDPFSYLKLTKDHAYLGHFCNEKYLEEGHNTSTPPRPIVDPARSGGSMGGTMMRRSPRGGIPSAGMRRLPGAPIAPIGGNTGYLGHFTRPTFLRAGHNTSKAKGPAYGVPMSGPSRISISKTGSYRTRNTEKLGASAARKVIRAGGEAAAAVTAAHPVVAAKMERRANVRAARQAGNAGVFSARLSGTSVRAAKQARAASVGAAKMTGAASVKMARMNPSSARSQRRMAR